MTIPATMPASTPTRTHVTNIVKLMTSPPSSPRYDSPASLPPHHCTRSASSPCAPIFAPAGWTRAQAVLTGGGSRRRPVAVLSHQKGREHFDRPLVEGAVVDHHLHGGAREPADPLGRRGGAHDDVHSSHQATQGGPLRGASPDQHDVGQAGVGDRVLQVVGRRDGGGGYAHPRPRRKLSQAVERLEMRLGEERDDRDAPAAQQPLHLRQMTEARDRGPPMTGLLLAPGDGRKLAEEDLVDANREVSFELPGKEVELRRAALHEEDFHGPLDSGGPNAGHA